MRYIVQIDGQYVLNPDGMVRQYEESEIKTLIPCLIESSEVLTVFRYDGVPNCERGRR